MKKESIINTLEIMKRETEYNRKRHLSYRKLGSKGKDSLTRIYNNEINALAYAIQKLKGDK